MHNPNAYENNEIVILDRTGKRPDGVEVYHGHVREWNDTSKDGISTEQRNALRKAGLVDKKGRIIKPKEDDEEESGCGSD